MESRWNRTRKRRFDAVKWKPNFKLKSVNFGLSPVISQWRGKAGFTWLVAPETTKDEVSDEDCIKKSDIIRLKLDNGRVVENFQMEHGAYCAWDTLLPDR